MIALTLQILRDNWMMAEASLPAHLQAAQMYLAGKEISTGFFSKLSLPAVPDNIALIPINGVMTKSDICGGMGTRSIANAISAATADQKKTAILLYWENVPGGQVDGTEALGQAINAAKAIKPVISMTSGMTCSAGVWGASQSTEWYATSATDTIGCIGAMARMKNPATANTDDFVEVYSDLSPDKNAEFRDVQVYKNLILNPMAKLFQQAVISGRGDKLKVEKEGLLTGSTFVANAAKANGLIDGIMPMEKVIQRANYLGNKNKKTTMSTTKPNGQFVFQNVLTAAKAEAAVPVEEGFALTEDQMNNLDTAIGENATALETANENLAAANAQIETLTEQATANATALEAAQNQVTALTARIAVLNKKPAITTDPAADKDPVEGKGKYHTSYDDEIKAHKEKYQIK